MKEYYDDSELYHGPDWKPSRAYDKTKSTAPLREEPEKFLDESDCSVCGARIQKGQPRVVILLVEIDSQNLGDYFLDGLSRAVAICSVCRGEKPYFKVLNLWFLDREGRAAADPGPSVRTVLAGDIAQRMTGSGGCDENAAEIEEAVLSGWNNPAPAPPTEDELRGRMLTLLSGPKSLNMPPQQRQVVALWAEGKTQTEIARALRVNQSTVCRMLNSAKARLYK